MLRGRRSACSLILTAGAALLAGLPGLAPAQPEAQALQGLELRVTGGATLTPAFNPSVTRYSAQVQSDIAAVTLAAQAPAGSVLKLSANGKPADAKTPLQVPLAVGSNQLELALQDASGKALGQIQIAIERENIQPVVDRFLKRSYADASTGRTMPYRLFVPEGAGPNQRYPLVVFLHGGGERGDDNEKTLTANQGGTVWAKPDEQARRPAYVLVPQGRATWDGGFGRTRNADNKIDMARAFEPADDLLTAQRLLRAVLDEHPGIDRSRLYLTGLSQGGLGSWAWNILEPELFAATVPVCGGAAPTNVAVLKNKPLWAFHAAADPIVPADFTRQAVAALRSAGGQPRFTEYDAQTYFFPIAHFSWVPAYQNEEMRAWLFSQKR
jgi:predicted peptidase